ncbi:hypothetical protein HAHE_19060 [Haloferula helveola]|uniref:Zinc ribbon domain-containing protein n=1 Tax=Haloferula helveola TaxID=490095 RepID=A0ABN6H4I5_9BACT|nr:hypothetical protein HAHE_19060 [Haloferula helveola]
MKREECPHCYATVVLTEAGDCPACGKSPRGFGADRSKTRITLSEGRKLPDICFCCGTDTGQRVSVRRATALGVGAFFGNLVNAIVGALNFVANGLLGLLNETSTRQAPVLRLRFRIPWCERCSKREGPKVDWVDFEEGKISMVVPKVVRNRLNRAKDRPWM